MDAVTDDGDGRCPSSKEEEKGPATEDSSCEHRTDKSLYCAAPAGGRREGVHRIHRRRFHGAGNETKRDKKAIREQAACTQTS